MIVEMVVQVADDFDLLLDDFGKHAILYGKQTCYFRDVLLFNPGLNAHPKRNPSNDLQRDTAQTPHIDDPRIFVLLHLLQHFLIIIHLVLIEDVVQDLRRHVFRSSH